MAEVVASILSLPAALADDLLFKLYIAQGGNPSLDYRDWVRSMAQIHDGRQDAPGGQP
jgi:hypothetical protein